MDIQTIRPALKQYVDAISRHVRIGRVLVHGSIVNKGHGEVHDIDVLVLSDDFAYMDTDTRSKLLYRASVGFPYDLHVYGVTNEEWEHASPLTTLGQIRNSPMIHVV